MRRRDFMALTAGAALAPLTALAQQADRMRRIGVLQAVAANDPEGPIRMAGFLRVLQQLVWAEGRNLADGRGHLCCDVVFLLHNARGCKMELVD